LRIQQTVDIFIDPLQLNGYVFFEYPEHHLSHFVAGLDVPAGVPERLEHEGGIHRMFCGWRIKQQGNLSIKLQKTPSTASANNFR